MSEMLREALEASSRVEEMLTADESRYLDLGKRLRTLEPAVIGTIARGSSDHAASYAQYLFPLCTGRLVASIPPSLITVLKAPVGFRGQFVLGISQSGGSPDIVAACNFARSSGALTVALVNQPNSRLEGVAEVTLAQHAGIEKSITATKSVLCTMAALARLAAVWSEDAALLLELRKLPKLLTQAASGSGALDGCSLAGVSHVFVLARGLGFGAGCELALKLKETCGIHAEAFSTAEVRHGPREIVDQKFLVIALALPGSGEADVLRAAEELRAQGARVITVTDANLGGNAQLPPGGDFRLAPLMALQLLYPWIARQAVTLGRNPDHPKTLKSKVIETN